jgi:predicted 2-oxoglutarate/Fe(II)-dependent dioxygenase YbiX
MQNVAPGIWRSPSEGRSARDSEMIQDLHGDAWLPAQVYSDVKDSRIADSSYRSAQVLGSEQLPEVISQLERETAEVSGILLRNFGGVYDPLGPLGSQLVRYRPGGFFKPHRDASHQYRNRCFTVIKYLTPCEGGQTCFPDQDYTADVRPGSWIIFYSEILHYAAPVISGEKIIFVTWLIAK